MNFAIVAMTEKHNNQTANSTATHLVSLDFILQTAFKNFGISGSFARRRIQQLDFECKFSYIRIILLVLRTVSGNLKLAQLESTIVII